MKIMKTDFSQGVRGTYIAQELKLQASQGVWTPCPPFGIKIEVLEGVRTTFTLLEK